MIKNQSGFPDPTADTAIGHVTAERNRNMRRPLVYICSPYRGDIDHNVEMAKKYSRFAIRQRKTPIAPHLLFPQILGQDETPATREVALFMGKQILRKCRELWWFGLTPTEGMKEEIEYADQVGVIIRHFTEKCKEVHGI